MTTSLFRERDRAKVERAARILDERRPGWFALIDLDHIDLGSPTHCVLAQVYRERRWWLRWLTFDDGFLRGTTDIDVERHGLHGVFAVDMFYREHWITAILSRRAAVMTPPTTSQESGEALQAWSVVGVGISE